MTVITSPRPTSPKERPAFDGDSFAGQQLATSYLVAGCERALFDLRCSLGRAGTSQEVRLGLEAAALLEDVLVGWRETLRQLRSGNDQSETESSASGARA